MGRVHEARALRPHKADSPYEYRGVLRGTPGSAYPQLEPNATELPSSAPGRPEFVELKASAPSPTPTRAEEHIATTPDCRPRALARRRAPKKTSHYTCWRERGTLHVILLERSQLGCPQLRCCRCR
jgi:hypothetical protein